jgi:hypothetical protein
VNFKHGKLLFVYIWNGLVIHCFQEIQTTGWTTFPKVKSIVLVSINKVSGFIDEAKSGQGKRGMLGLADEDRCVILDHIPFL